MFWLVKEKAFREENPLMVIHLLDAEGLRPLEKKTIRTLSCGCSLEFGKSYWISNAVCAGVISQSKIQEVSIQNLGRFPRLLYINRLKLQDTTYCWLNDEKVKLRNVPIHSSRRKNSDIEFLDGPFHEKNNSSWCCSHISTFQHNLKSFEINWIVSDVAIIIIQ